jgi:Protein of unknown function (DUF3303)
MGAQAANEGEARYVKWTTDTDHGRTRNFAPHCVGPGGGRERRLGCAAHPCRGSGHPSPTRQTYRPGDRRPVTGTHGVQSFAAPYVIKPALLWISGLARRSESRWLPLSSSGVSRIGSGASPHSLKEASRGDMLFMVIERFHNQDAKPVYKRFREQGRLASDGLTYVGSWVEASLDRCFQLMECDVC